MNENLINQYVDRITYNDIVAFAKRNDIVLNDTELKLVYNKIKTNYKTIIYGNPTSILNELKNNISNDSYKKIEKLYYDYKSKYKSFL